MLNGKSRATHTASAGFFLFSSLDLQPEVAIIATMATLTIGHTIDAREAQNNFGALLDAARQRPITIKKYGRKVVVMLSAEEYALFEKIEDQIWGERAVAAEKNGTMGVKASRKFMDSLIMGSRHARPRSRQARAKIS